MKVDGSNAVSLLLLIGGLSLVPTVVFCVTGFSRILIVLGFVRTALGIQNTPPNQVLVGIALFLTLFVMYPTVNSVEKVAWDPYQAGHISVETAITRGEQPVRQFMFKQTNDQELSLFVGLSKIPTPKTEANVPTYVLIPAFMMSELKIAFEIGFLIYLPFLIIDLVVSATLMSMGMIMLPPTFISTPFKLLLFVLMSGWDLLARALVTSFH